MSPAAWQGFAQLQGLLDPFQKALQSVRDRTATVAGLARQWLRLASALKAEAGALDPGETLLAVCLAHNMILGNQVWGSGVSYLLQGQYLKDCGCCLRRQGRHAARADQQSSRGRSSMQLKDAHSLLLGPVAMMVPELPSLARTRKHMRTGCLPA